MGELWIQANERGITAVSFDALPIQTSAPTSDSAEAHLAQAMAELTDYFTGQRQAFTVPLAARGTAFQTQVWTALYQLPFGVTASYRDIARAIGNEKAVRAVGAANGRNPIAIIVPCHRVIGTNGTLTGYAGGLARKQWLLAHEGVGQRPLL
ncbi:methylated DNA-protein cysteine methyltransferase [Simiduia agarivorans SA1 = DSM 21679]|uniref:Methylated-DNA--protein-cysteine methyltransferase n=2 Tax=Simiduia TaxID=447467 RepID=K4KG01_SIMAS|nr:methylated DNA-protein cysteine methyltransferase [Simiduia agarivorans SA1 = DSM 21679]